MGHSQSRIFQVYLNQRVKRDVQAAFLGRPSQDALIRAVGHMSRSLDPRAPTALTPEELVAIKIDPTIVKLRQSRDTLSLQMKSSYGSINKAEGTEMYKDYTHASAALRREITYRKNSAFGGSRNEYFRTIDTKELEEQLIDPLLIEPERKYSDSEVVKHRFEERSRIAEMLCDLPSHLTKQERLDRRIKAIKDLTALCSLREVPRQDRLPSGHRWGILSEEEALKSDLFPTTCTSTQCLFCLGNDQLSYACRLFHLHVLT